MSVAALRRGLAEYGFWGCLAIALWSVLLIAVIIRVAIAKPTSGSVFPIYLGGSALWSERGSLYFHPVGNDLYRYPPPVALAMQPFLHLPHKLAAILWRLMGVALFLGGMYAWGRKVIPGPISKTRWAFFYGLTIPLVLHSYNNAQINTHLIGLILLGGAACASGAFNTAALVLACATLLKLYPIAVALLFLVCEPKRLGLRYVAWLAALIALPFCGNPPAYVIEQYRGWFGQLFIDDRTTAALERAGRDVFLVLRVWFGEPLQPTQWRWVQIAVGGIFAIWVYRRRAADGTELQPTWNLALHLGAIWMTAFGPCTESCTYTILAPTVAAVTVFGTPERSYRVWAVLFVANTMFLIVLIAGLFPMDWRVQTLGPQPIGALLILGVIACERSREKAAEK